MTKFLHDYIFIINFLGSLVVILLFSILKFSMIISMLLFRFKITLLNKFTFYKVKLYIFIIYISSKF